MIALKRPQLLTLWWRMWRFEIWKQARWETPEKLSLHYISLSYGYPRVGGIPLGFIINVEPFSQIIVITHIGLKTHIQQMGNELRDSIHQGNIIPCIYQYDAVSIWLLNHSEAISVLNSAVLKKYVSTFYLIKIGTETRFSVKQSNAWFWLDSCKFITFHLCPCCVSLPTIIL